MFIEEVYRVVWNEKDVIEDGEDIIEVTPDIKRRCSMLTKVHALLIGSGVFFAYALAQMLGSTSFFSDILMVVCVLTMLTILTNGLSRFLIRKRVKKNV